jgi:4-amino-4-deoxy-L-arabinose transferase-like glycosyltransferase
MDYMYAVTIAELPDRERNVATAHSPRRRVCGFGGAYVLIPVVLAGVLLLTNLGGRANLDGHEVLVAQTAREMLRSGDWLVPRFSAEVRLQKPPLAYWLAGISFHLSGRIDETSARLPAAVATILCVLLVTAVGARAFGPTAGLWAGLIHATTYATLCYGKQAVVDGVLAFMVAMAVFAAAYDRLCTRVKPAAAILAFWTAMGLTILAKGPIGLAIALPTALLYRWFRGRRPTDRPIFWHRATFAGLGVFLLLALAWPFAVAVRFPQAVWVWKAQSVDRFLWHWGPNTKPWFYYFYQAPLMTMPWSPIWLAAPVFALRKRKAEGSTTGEDWTLLLWIWFGFTLVLLSLSQGKREHYILPGLTPLSLIVANAVCGGSAARTSRIRWASGVVAAVSLAGAVHDLWISPALCRRTGALEMFTRNRRELASAPAVVQFGNTDRWAVFPLDRPMIWATSTKELSDIVATSPGILVIATEQNERDALQAVGGAVVDRSIPRSWIERRSSDRWVLIRPGEER